MLLVLVGYSRENVLLHGFRETVDIQNSRNTHLSVRIMEETANLQCYYLSIH